MIQDTLTSPPTIPSGSDWPEQGHWTYEDWLRLPDDGNRYEVIDGVLHMEPPPGLSTHQRPAGRLFIRMTEFVEAHHLGEAFIAPAGVRLPNQPVPLQPDIFFVAAGRSDVQVGNYLEGTPDLIVEVRSPSTATYDRTRKFRVYEEAGVREYWLVDSRARVIEVYMLAAGRYELPGRWGPGGQAVSQVLAGYAVAVDELFA